MRDMQQELGVRPGKRMNVRVLRPGGAKTDDCLLLAIGNLQLLHVASISVTYNNQTLLRASVRLPQSTICRPSVGSWSRTASSRCIFDETALIAGVTVGATSSLGFRRLRAVLFTRPRGSTAS